MATKKTASKRVPRKKDPVEQAILYVRVDRSMKAWLKAACRKQPGHVSQSTMIQRILKSAKKNPDYFNVAA